MENDLKFSGQNPVVITWNGSAENVFQPIVTRSCDVTIVSNDILDDLYTSTKDGVQTYISTGNSSKSLGYYYKSRYYFYGYLQPNVYTQSVTQNLDTITVTSIDSLSMLKYITIDKLYTRPNIVTFRDLLAKALASVMLFPFEELYVCRYVSYDGKYNGMNGLLDFSVQISNFWDELGEPDTLYNIISEILKLFGMVIYKYDMSDGYYISPVIQTFKDAEYDEYYVYSDGRIIKSSLVKTKTELYTDSDSEGKYRNKLTSNNISDATVEINNTYDKVTGTANTSIPEYSNNAFDKVTYQDRDKYDAGWLNVDKNKVKGYYTKNYTTAIDGDSHWEYLWNGVYTNADYGLVSSDGSVNGFLNINNAYEYLGNTGNQIDYGSILNFYGGVANPLGEGKTETTERQVEVQECITAYAADNGTVPEFLDRSDLKWVFDDHYENIGNDGATENPTLTKDNSTDAKWGVMKGEQTSSRIVYHQEYSNMQLIQGDAQTIQLTLAQSYSRTGINHDIELYSTDYSENNMFLREKDGDGGYNYKFISSDLYYIPALWNSNKVKVAAPFFNSTPQWDKRRIDFYVKTTAGTVYQFNGKEWIEGTEVSETNSFYLCKLMNNQQLFHTQMRYDMIECCDGEKYTLTGENITVRLKNGEVVTTGGSATVYKPYNDETNEWFRYIDNVSEGIFNILLPDINSINASVCCDIYNSTFLGRTGDRHSVSTLASEFYFHYTQVGKVKIIDEESAEVSYTTINNTSPLYTQKVQTTFIPHNVDFVKAEHLNAEITVSVPKSNLGQMFSESDIQYTLDRSKGYLEKYEGPNFRVNTFHMLVKSSQSYIIYNDVVCDGGSFVFDDKIVARPECYVVQAYYNWLGKIRRIYNKTFCMFYLAYNPNNNTYEKWYNYTSLFRKLIKSQEMDVQRTFMVCKDVWDLKTSRHTIQSIECDGMEVTTIDAFSTIEIPRQARNSLFNLPTAKKS